MRKYAQWKNVSELTMKHKKQRKEESKRVVYISDDFRKNPKTSTSIKETNKGDYHNPTKKECILLNCSFPSHFLKITLYFGKINFFITSEMVEYIKNYFEEK